MTVTPVLSGYEPCTATTLLRRSAMLQQTYAAALWYVSDMMVIVHTDKSSSETVSGNESGGTTASFGNDSKLLAIQKLRKTVRQQSQAEINQNQRAQRQQSNQGSSGERIVENNRVLCHPSSYHIKNQNATVHRSKHNDWMSVVGRLI